MLWNEFIKLNHVSKLSLNEQLRKFNEHIMYEEQVAGSIIRIPVTIIIRNVGCDDITWYKNGVLQNIFTDRIDHTFTINAGDTFFVQATRIPTSAFIDYSLNGSFVTTYADYPSFTTTTPTFTAVGRNIYRFDAINPD
jgi:hypothetical protein